MDLVPTHCRVCGKARQFSADAVLDTFRNQGEVRAYCDSCLPSRDVSGLAEGDRGAAALVRCDVLWDFLIKNFPQGCQEAEQRDPTADAVDAALYLLTSFKNKGENKHGEEKAVK